MARIYKPPECNYEFVGNAIHTDGSVLRKVTGTSMGGILGISPFTTPFQVACSLLGLAREDISDKPAVKTGQFLEGRIIDYIGQVYPEYGVFVPAEIVHPKREGDHDTWESDFEDDVFAGHVDGYVMNGDDNYILEIKTSANMKSWENGVPEYYFWQVALYNHFITHKDKAYVVLGVVDEDTYKDPSLWVPQVGENVFMYEIDIDQEEVAKTLEQVKEWYTALKDTFCTPSYDLNNLRDVEMYEHLVGLASDKGTVMELIDQYFKLDSEEKEYDDVIKDKRKLKEGIKVKIKEWLDVHGESEVNSASGLCYATITVKNSEKIDPELLRADGLDPSKYTITTQTKTFTVKKRK